MFASLQRKISDYLSRYLSTRVIFVMDMFFSLLATVLTLMAAQVFINSLTFGWRFSLIALCMSFLASAGVFVLFKSYRIVIRHSSFKDVYRFAVVAVTKSLLVTASMIVASELIRGVMFSPYFFVLALLDIFLTFFFLVTVRMVMILAYGIYTEKVSQRHNLQRILICGINDKTVALVLRLQNSKHFDIRGFITEDRKKNKLTISQLPIYFFDTEKDLESIRRKLGVSGILFSGDEDIKKQSGKLVEYALHCGLKIYKAPSIDEIKQENIHHSSIREVLIEDLLGREEIRISLEEIEANFRGRTVMVTGAAGSIGSELCRQLAKFGVGKLVLYDNAETPMHNLRLEFDEKFPEVEYVPIIGDVRLSQRLDFAFRTYRPQVVFHAAAYKHVPLMEENPCEAVLVNVAGSRNVADKCIEYGVEKMVMISTDKAVNPTNIMGCTKRLAEIYVQSLGLAIEHGEVKGATKFVTTRFGNVLGSNGSVIPRFREQIMKGGPVTVTHPDITRFFMTIPEACRLVMEAAVLPTENRICVFDMGEPVKIDSMARKMIELSGCVPDVDIKIVYSGLRPGEKLYEEVLSNVENTDPTSHERIRIAKVREYAYGDALKAVTDLEALSRAVNIPDMVKMMKAIVPEYISNNSKFSEYDKK